jgi:hypothetical protein
MTKLNCKKIADDKVINVWKCNCGERARINPDFYQDNGTPMCTSCDDDMEYSHTEIVD